MGKMGRNRSRLLAASVKGAKVTSLSVNELAIQWHNAAFNARSQQVVSSNLGSHYFFNIEIYHICPDAYPTGLSVSSADFK